jgi:sigma-B regulation protein RsbU (phosphoserine phosphatase)
MAAMILDFLLVLLQLLCVIAAVACVLTRSRFFSSVLDGHPALKVQILLVCVFGALSVYGSISGDGLLPGAIINFRDFGPMAGGLVGGPMVGLGAGLIGAAYRGTLGGVTVIASVTATILAGLFGGLIWLANGRRCAGITVAVVFAVLMESLHLLLTLAISRPFAAAMDIVADVAIPMVLANAAGMFIFAFFITGRENDRKVQGNRDALLRETAREGAELEIAVEIQKSSLPDSVEPAEGFEIAARCAMAKEAGGTVYDVVPFERGKRGILIADAAGTGVPAALFAALLRIVVRVNATRYRDNPDLVIRDSNNQITAGSRTGMFATAFYGIIDSTARSLTYVNAGHNPAVILRSRDGTIAELGATGIAMGISTDADYRAETYPLDAGDILVLYTDGITEATDEQEQMFGEERLHEVIRSTPGAGAEEILARILDAVRLFAGKHPQSDDITLMVIRVM